MSSSHPSAMVASPGTEDMIPEIERIEDPTRFEALSEEWTELLSASRSDCVFLTWEWLFTWWKHLGGRRRLSILAVRSNGRLIGLAPLAIARPTFARLCPLPQLEFLGTGAVGSDYLDLIIRRGYESPVMMAVADFVAGRRLMVGLTNMATPGSAAWLLERELTSRGWRCSRSVTDVCPFVDLRGQNWSAYLDTRSHGFRTTFRRRLNSLRKIGDVQFELTSDDPSCRESLEQLVAWHLMRCRDRGGSTAFHRPELLAFHREFSRLARARGWLRLFSLRVDGFSTAHVHGLRYGHTFSCYQTAFDARYAKYSVGLVAMGLSIKAAIEEGCSEYDLLHGDEAFKFHWAPDARKIGRLELYPPDALGSLCRGTVELNRAARRTVRRQLLNALSS